MGLPNALSWVMTIIVYEAKVAAVTGTTRVYLSPHLALLPDDDPLVVFVAVMATYAVRVRRGSAPGPYTDARAALFARLVLMDDATFKELDELEIGDVLVAGHFGVPVEQVAEKRADLHQFG
jgi:hypothetical protein